MNIAVVGAGFSGLALSWHLLNIAECTLTIFDGKGIGGGASGIATGLLHPYPGEVGRRSLYATEGLAATERLLEIAETALGRPVARREGIVRMALDEEQAQSFLKHAAPYDDLIQQGERTFFIKSGITVDAKAYLEGLWQACASLGASFQQTQITSLDELQSYDYIILAMGAGVLQMEGCKELPVRGIKGQVLMCTPPAALEHSMISKGYVAWGLNPEICHVGATYEREFTSDEPDLEKTVAELSPRFPLFFGDKSPKLHACHSAIRVMNTKSYLPFTQKLNDKTYVITGMGSRGLLYHAYFAEQLAQTILVR